MLSLWPATVEQHGCRTGQSVPKSNAIIECLSLVVDNKDNILETTFHRRRYVDAFRRRWAEDNDLKRKCSKNILPKAVDGPSATGSAIAVVLTGDEVKWGRTREPARAILRIGKFPIVRNDETEHNSLGRAW